MVPNLLVYDYLQKKKLVSRLSLELLAVPPLEPNARLGTTGLKYLTVYKVVKTNSTSSRYNSKLLLKLLAGHEQSI